MNAHGATGASNSALPTPYRVRFSGGGFLVVFWQLVAGLEGLEGRCGASEPRLPGPALAVGVVSSNGRQVFAEIRVPFFF